MKTLTGTVRWLDLEGGLWVLEAGGARYQLAGGDEALRRDGRAVEVRGEVDAEAMGIGMTGPVLRVRSWRDVSG